jgi:FixJ family two-component response regulator
MIPVVGLGVTALSERKLLAQAQTRPLVWVVDDDSGIRAALARLFRATALEVETFRSGADMHARLLHRRPRCLVLDLVLPGQGGLDIQRALRERGEAIPVVFISGEGDVRSGVAAMKDGAIDFLQKPLETDALLGAVMRGLAQEAEWRWARARSDQARQRIATLTRREREVLFQAASGKPNKAIAIELGASEKTIKIHRGRMMRKLGATSVVDLVRLTDWV